MSFEVITTFDAYRQKQLRALYQHAWWTKTRTLEEIEMMIANTQFNFGLVDTNSDQLVAYTRVLSDRIYKGFIFDVIVDPALRGHGLGTK